MFALLISEVKYFRFLLALILLFPVVFTFSTLSNAILFENVYFMEKYFWSTLIGLGTYGLLFTIWTVKLKERRSRIYLLLPKSKIILSLTRWLFGITPLIFLLMYLYILKYFIPYEQTIQITRTTAQLGLLIIFLASFDFIINFESSLFFSVAGNRWMVLISVVLILILLSIGVIFLVTKFSIEGLAELLFNTWGIFIFTISTVLYYNRTTFS